MNITVESLEKKFKGEGESRYRELSILSGAGLVNFENDPTRTFDGGIDLTGVFDPANKEFTDAQRSKIRELSGITEAKADATKDASPTAAKQKAPAAPLTPDLPGTPGAGSASTAPNTKVSN